VMEERTADAMFALPEHPYTAALLSAMPERHTGGDRLATIPGVVPGLNDRPVGCLFAPRCTFGTPACGERPALREWRDGLVRCHYPLGDPARDANIARDLAVTAVLPS
jgi:dipeptide transport system ATP-binding protein